MLSLKHRFLFVHIPKTGGNSIQKALIPYSEDQITTHLPFQDGIDRFGIQNSDYPYHKHATLREYKNLIPKKIYSPLTKFTVVRNPWERMISFYYSPHENRSSFDPKVFEKVVNDAKSINEFVDTRTRLEKLLGKNPLSHGEIRYFLRFERLQENFEQVCRSLGLPALTLDILNTSSKGDYRSYYNQKLKNLVKDKFKNEIEYFGYQF